VLLPLTLLLLPGAATAAPELLTRPVSGEHLSSDAHLAETQALSADGSRVVFSTWADNVDAVDTGMTNDVFVRDRSADTTIRVSARPDGGEPNGPSLDPAISADGEHVAFYTLASDLGIAFGDRGSYDLVVRDLRVDPDQPGAYRVVALDITGRSSGGPPAINADGSVVAWSANDDDLSPDDTDFGDDVFARDLAAGTPIELLSPGTSSFQGAVYPSIDDRGDRIAFTTSAPLAGATDTNGGDDAYVRIRSTNTYIRASLGAAGQEPDWWLDGRAVISGDGRTVAFATPAALVSTDTNGQLDTYLRRLDTGTTTRASVGGADREANGATSEASLSSDGQVVGLLTTADDLVPGRGPAAIRDRARTRTIAPAISDGAPVLSADGRSAAYPITTELPGGGRRITELFLEPIAAPTDTTAPELTVPANLTVPARTADGTRVRFEEHATDRGGSGLTGTSCSPASGSRFPIGVTTVRCVATDADGNETTDSFTITVRDEQAPRIAAPDAITLSAPAGGTTPWATDIPANDLVDGESAATCTPAQGAALPIGTTSVTCRATDLAGNAGAATFPVHVVAAPATDDVADVTITEAATPAAVQLTLAAPAPADRTLQIERVGGTAKERQDFAAGGDEFTIAAGERTATVSVNVRDDDREESPETMQVRLLDGATVLATGTVTILDDDAPHPDRRRTAEGPLVWVDDLGHRLLALDPGDTEPRVLAIDRARRFVDPQVSPDGTEVVYGNGLQILVRPLEGGRPTTLFQGSDVELSSPVWRPDGEAVAFLVHEGSASAIVIQSTDLDRQPTVIELPQQSGGRISWNPDGTQLAFGYAERWTGGWTTEDIAIVDADSGEITQRWETPAAERMPQWSRDGRSIVMLRAQRRTGPDTLYDSETVAILDVATGEVRDLTPTANWGETTGSNALSAPVLSPDSTRVAFFWLENDNPEHTTRYRFAEVPAAGGAITTRLDFTPGARRADMPNGTLYDWGAAPADGPSDDGRIIFTRRSPDASGTMRLLSARPDGTDERVVADTGTVNAQPAVSRDGAWLAFRSTRHDTTGYGNGDIFVATPGGRAAERLTRTTGDESRPALSPDGRLVAFVRDSGEARSIVVLDRDSGEERTVVPPTAGGVDHPAFLDADTLLYTGSASSLSAKIRAIDLDGTAGRLIGQGHSPAASPDGTHVAWVSEAATGNSQIFVARADGTSAERITNEAYGARNPSFGPDDRSLTYETSGGIVRALITGAQTMLVTTGWDVDPTWARPYAAPSMRIADVRLAEGTGATPTAARFAITLSRPIDEDVTVAARTVDGTATSPRDFAARAAERITVPAGTTALSYDVAVAADPMDEPDESFTVVLSAAERATLARTTAEATIEDDDAPPVLTVSDVELPEGDLGDTDAVLHLQLSAESGWTASVHAETADGTADADDYAARSTTVTFAPGVTEQLVRVPVHGDTQEEPDEQFTLALSAASHLTAPAGPTTVTIRNDDTSGKAPDTGITGDPAPIVNTPAPTFTFIGSVPRGQFECRVDGAAWAACTTPHRVRPLVDGAHRFEVRALDGTLVDPTPAAHEFTVDTIAPATTITAGPRRVTADRTPQFTMTTDDPSARIECRLDGAAWRTCGTRWQAPELADGTHEFAARAVDQAGNADPTPAALSFRIDTTPPQTSWGTKPGSSPQSTPTSSPASVGLGSGAGTPQLAVDGQGQVAVPVTCASAAATACTGEVSLEEATGVRTASGARARRAAATGELARTAYAVAPGSTLAIRVRLGASVRARIERTGRIDARARLLSPDGAAAPVGVVLAPDAAAPRLLAAGMRIRVTGTGRTVRIAVRCPIARACTGRVELRIAGRRAAPLVALRGRAGRTVRLRFALTPRAAAAVRARRTTTATMRATWGFPTQAKAADLTLIRGAKS
jgi:Tol biopolymer transport system component